MAETHKSTIIKAEKKGDPSSATAIHTRLSAIIATQNRGVIQVFIVVMGCGAEQGGTVPFTTVFGLGQPISGLRNQGTNAPFSEGSKQCILHSATAAERIN